MQTSKTYYAQSGHFIIGDTADDVSFTRRNGIYFLKNQTVKIKKVRILFYVFPSKSSLIERYGNETMVYGKPASTKPDDKTMV